MQGAFFYHWKTPTLLIQRGCQYDGYVGCYILLAVRFHFQAAIVEVGRKRVGIS
jgi:hypothetical protein